MKMVDRIPDALSGAMGNQMYVATFATREEMEQFYADVLAVTDGDAAAAQAELSQVLALGEPTTSHQDPHPRCHQDWPQKPEVISPQKLYKPQPQSERNASAAVFWHEGECDD